MSLILCSERLTARVCVVVVVFAPAHPTELVSAHTVGYVLTRQASAAQLVCASCIVS